MTEWLLGRLGTRAVLRQRTNALSHACCKGRAGASERGGLGRQAEAARPRQVPMGRRRATEQRPTTRRNT